MTIADLILKAKVNLALARDPRVGVLDVGVDVADGTVTLSGDVDSDEERSAAAEIARGVDGVTTVRSEITCGVGRKEETVEMVVHELLHRLDEAWNGLPDRSAISEADYLRWALWVCCKFRIPERLGGEEREKQEADALEQALAKIAGQVGAPKSLIALEMLRQADLLSASPPRPAAAAER